MDNKKNNSTNPIEFELTDPSLVARLLIYIIIAILFTTIIFSCVFYVDVLVTGQGKLTPTQEVQYVQPQDSGVLLTLNVKNGDPVKAGDILLKLDPSLIEIELQKVNQE